MSTDVQVTEKFHKAMRRALRFIPLYILVPIAIAICFNLAGYPIEWSAFILGAIGWFVALLLRGPISNFVSKMPKQRGENIIVASSGVLEESIRLILIALSSATTSWALSLGQGWAAVEVLFVIINVLAIWSLRNRTDDQSRIAIESLQARGTLDTNPIWGVLERIWASAFHIGSTLLVAMHPWTVLLLIPIHSGLNWFAARIVKRSVAASNAFVACVGVVILVIGLLLI